MLPQQSVMRHQMTRSGSGPAILAAMSPRELDHLMEYASVVEVPARRVLLNEGLRPTHLYILLDGTAELFVRRGRRESSLELVKRDVPFVLAAVVKDAPYLMSARTVSDARILCLSAARFRTSMRRDPGLALATTAAMSDAYRSVVRQFRIHRLHCAQTRLAHYLIGLQHKAPGANTVTLEVSKRRLASLLGIKPESLSRVFAGLSNYGVQVDGNNITIADFRVLEDLSQYDYDLENE